MFCFFSETVGVEENHYHTWKRRKNLSHERKESRWWVECLVITIVAIENKCCLDHSSKTDKGGIKLSVKL